jgi:hypothetical protein
LDEPLEHLRIHEGGAHEHLGVPFGTSGDSGEKVLYV